MNYYYAALQVLIVVLSSLLFELLTKKPRGTGKLKIGLDVCRSATQSKIEVIKCLKSHKIRHNSRTYLFTTGRSRAGWLSSSFTHCTLGTVQWATHIYHAVNMHDCQKLGRWPHMSSKTMQTSLLVKNISQYCFN